MIAQSYVPPDEVRERRALVRGRKTFVDKRKDFKNELHSLLDQQDVKTIHDDLQVLAEFDIIHFEQAGRAKRPFVPYETIEINLEISTPNHADDVASA